jgi:hypothetical protein
MKKILLSLSMVVLLIGMAFSPYAMPALAADVSATLTTSAKLQMIQTANPDCYAYQITYTYTITNHADKIKIKQIVDELSNGQQLSDYTVHTLNPNLTYTVDMVYDATNDVIAGLDSITDNATAIITAYVNNNPVVLTCDKITTVLPKYITPAAFYLNKTPWMDWVVNPDDRHQAGGVTLNPGQSFTWLSSATAEAEVVYNPGTWTLLIHSPQDWAAKPTICFGEWDGSAFTSQKYGPLQVTAASYDDNNYTYTIEFTDVPQITIGEGHSLALQITNDANSAVTIVTCNRVGGAYLEPPAPKPNWPLPELSTVLLLGFGLLGLGGFVLVQKRRAHPLA